MSRSVVTEDIVALLAAWGGPVEPAVLNAIAGLGVDEVMRAFMMGVADLLELAAHNAEGDDQLSASILVERAVALARSGQMAAAAALAEPVLDRAELPVGARGALLRTTLLAYASDARIDDVDRIVGSVDRSGYPPKVLGRLDATCSFVHVLRGDAAARRGALAAALPEAMDATTGTLPWVKAAIASLLAGDGLRAVELADFAADRFDELRLTVGDELASVEIWPTLFRCFVHGHDNARAHLDAWRARCDLAAQPWVTAYHQITSATLVFAAGELDDAVTQLDEALGTAASTGQGWTSWAVGLRSRIDLVRGDGAAALARVQAFGASRRPSTLGLRIVDQVGAEALLALGEPDPDPLRSWTVAVAEDNRLWMLLGGLDDARVARRRGLDPRPILERLAELEAPSALAHVPAFARASLAMDVEAATECVEQARRVGGALHVAQLAADAALVLRVADPGTARRLATRAVADLREIGAIGEERAVVAESREHGIRLGVRGARTRPATGWGALTATEERVVALVAEGATGPEIGRILYISPRTVQTHVSHALGKLGLSSRLELAAAHTQRRE